MDLLDPQVEIKKDDKTLAEDLASKIITVINESLGMDGTEGKGKEWIKTSMLKPRKKKDIIRSK